MGTASAREPRVCCVIVNWNGWRDTLECLATLRLQDYPALDIIVVDNGSSDDSVARIREAFPEVQLIETGKNLGFPGGVNAGLSDEMAHTAELFWLLNNDTLCPPDTLTKLVRKAQASPEAGMIGSVLYYAHDPTRVQAWGGGRLLPWIGNSTHFTEPSPLDRDCYLTFASVLIRREVLEQVGLLYEGFFMYYEDGDLCLRMQRAGWSIAVAEDTAILHKEGGSMPKRETALMARTRTVAGLRFIQRNSRWWPAGGPVFVLLRLARRATNGDWRNLPAVLAGAWTYLREPMPR